MKIDVACSQSMTAHAPCLLPCCCQQATSSILRLHTRSRAIRFSRVGTLASTLGTLDSTLGTLDSTLGTLDSTLGTLDSLLATRHSQLKGACWHHSSRCTADKEPAAAIASWRGPLNGGEHAGDGHLCYNGAAV
jgi:hypothetical protein